MTPTTVARFAAGHAAGRWRGLAALAVIVAVEIALGVLTPWPMKWIVDAVLGSAAPPPWLAGFSKPSLLLFCVGATVAIQMIAGGVGLIQGLVSVDFGQGLTYDVSTRMFDHLQRLSLRFHARQAVGDSIRRIVSDCGCVTTLVRDCALPAAASVVTLGVMAGVCAFLDWRLSLLAAVVMPLMLPLFLKLGPPIADRAYDYAEAESAGYERIERALVAIPVVQSFSRETDNDRALSATYADTLAAAVRSNWAQMKLRVSTGLVTATGSAAILIVGGREVLHGQLTVGGLLVFLSYLASVYSPLESIVDSSRHTLDAAGSARRVLELLGLDRDVTDRPDAVPLVVNGPGCELAISDVTFGYEPDRPVLRGLSLVLRPGEIVAIVGPSGAGKTTLLSLIPRLYDPSAGQITFDGQDLRGVTLRSLRGQIGIVLQQPFLFPMSIADNIAYGRPDATRDQIVTAARAAAVHDFIAALPDGYDTILGDRGATLSVGQRQRVSIARAILKDPPLLLLDEPTSALDAVTESNLVDGLRSAGGGRTTLIIAHRLSTVRAADRIAVLDGGVIADTGTHGELMGRSNLYADLCRHQLAEGT